jgi:TfoX/Sxy family transcriptional regulator of competence genes
MFSDAQTGHGGGDMTMKWRRSPETLVQRFSEIVPLDPRVERRKMFGYPAAFVAGNLFMGLHQEALILRLSDDDRESFLKIEGASVFEPMPGRPMREYVVVPSRMVDRETSLAGWIRRSLNHAAAIPSKNAKRREGTGKKRPAAKRGGAKTKHG